MPQLVKLHFKAPVHLGEAGLGLEESAITLHSDTLFSSIFQVWLRLYGCGPPDLLITSAFPYVGEKYFFPRPLIGIPGFTPELGTQFGKELKKLRFVSLRYFSSWVRGEAFDCGRMLEDSRELNEALAVAVRPRVALDRLTSAPSLYFVGETRFDRLKGAGLFFLVDVAPGDWARFKAAVKLLGEEGIGGRRSQGYGVFEPEFPGEIKLEGPDRADGFVTLSLVYPETAEEVRDNLLAYRLVERTGWLEGAGGNRGLRHLRVLMFGEGSVFKKPVRGRLVDVTPKGFDLHRVYRNGRAFGVGVRLEGGGS